MSVLRATDIAFSYGRGPAVLEGVSLEVASGERVALQAPSGRGKSTLCQILAGYLEPTSGSVSLDGSPIVARSGIPSPVQLVWQHPEQVMDPYVRIGASMGEAGAVSEDLMRALGIRDEWLGRFPHEVSGGELQRCCLARALSAQPQFIVADEISTMLDAITQAQIWDCLLAYCAENNCGLVLVTHSEALAQRLATRTVAL